jgi:HAE1 family hydrophobic/amphiphilic exporter-1
MVLALAAGGALSAWLWGAGELWWRGLEAALIFAAVSLFRVLYRRLRGHDGLGFGDVKFVAAGTLWIGADGIPGLLLIAVLVIYLVLGVLYESLIHPLTILSALLFAGFGAVVTLMLFGIDLNVYAFVGVILLVGLVKKNGIMMIDFAIEARKDPTFTAERAITDACLVRFRPIMMTTMAALLGGVPLMLGNGTGSEIRQPLGYAMVGGLIVSQMLTLFTTPVIYLYLDKVNNAFARWGRTHIDHEPDEAAAPGPVKEAAE